MKLWLLCAVALVLGGLRWLLPPMSGAPPVVVAAVERTSSPQAPAPVSQIEEAPRATESPILPSSTDTPGNLFAVKLPPAPPAPPPAPPEPMQKLVKKAVSAQSEPAPLPLPPLQVIGTYEDALGPAVFIESPDGTVVARVKTVVANDFRVTAITAQQVSLMQVSTQRLIQLNIPFH